ncbi:hypothetical protein [Haloarcula montana]|uniref:hypothetical protein n=1 Tax=Haloarcula montana TaxID=3111776 RepID=UPI002D79D534|nr:hypothetical protein [Haloarcula sp. GH36]
MSFATTLIYLTGDREQQQEALKILVIGPIGIPILTVVLMAGFLPTPWNTGLLELLGGLGYVAMFLLGPFALGGLFVGLGILTAAITQELVGEYA